MYICYTYWHAYRQDKHLDIQKQKEIHIDVDVI